MISVPVCQQYGQRAGAQRQRRLRCSPEAAEPPQYPDPGPPSGGCQHDRTELGAGERERVSETVRYSILSASAINLIFGVVFLSTPVLCFRAFTPDETVLAYAGMCMFTLVVGLPARSLMPGCNALIDA